MREAKIHLGMRADEPKRFLQWNRRQIIIRNVCTHKRTRLLASSPQPMKSTDVSEFHVTKEKQQITMKSRKMLAAIFITTNSS